MSPHTVIIGGGIGGLATAHRLQAIARAGGPGRRITVIEAGTRWGGVIATAAHDGLVMELGPDAVISTKPAGLALMRELGLESQLIGVEPAARRSFIARGNRLVAVPDGLYLMAPARLWPFAWSPLLSSAGKLRMAMDLAIPRRAADAPEESLGAFVRRRLGAEALARIAQPMVSGIWSADPERLSVAATMPQFIAMEREHRSLILGLRARSRAEGQHSAAVGSGPRYGLFATLRGGLQVLVDSLLAELSRCDLRLGTAVAGVQREGNGWTVRLADGGMITADEVVLALPAHAAARLLVAVDGRLSELLDRIPYAGIATVNVAFARDRIAALPAGAGFVVPACENRTLLACTLANQKFAGRAPNGRVLLRACAGGALRGNDLLCDDAELVARLTADLHDLLGLRGDPDVVRIQRWPAALPQYLVGHQALVAEIRAAETRLPGLALVGNAYEGTGIPDVIANAETSARRLARVAGPAQGTARFASQSQARNPALQPSQAAS